MSVADQLRKEGEIKGREEGIHEGEIKGREEERKKVAKKMLQLNMNEEQIISITGFSRDELEQIKDELLNNVGYPRFFKTQQ